MKPKLTIEYGPGNFLTIRHAGHLMEIYPDSESSCYVMTHRKPSGTWIKEFYSTVEIREKFLDLITSRMGLSHLWNGQRDLF